MLTILLGSWLLGRISEEAAAKKGTGALQGVKPTKRGKPKTELAAAQRMQKVSQATIDSMKSMGMQKAIQKANSGNASAEFVEGAKRMYGKRVQPENMMKDGRPLTDAAKRAEKQTKSSPTVTKSISSAKNKKGPIVAARDADKAAAAERRNVSTRAKSKGKSQRGY